MKSEVRLFRILFAALALMAGALSAPNAIAGARGLPGLENGSDSKDFTIGLLPHGTEMGYSGRIAFGASAALRAALNANPTVKILHLASNGGNVFYARQMEYLVYDRGLTTVVDSHCLSACALIFLAGQERYLAPGAKLGFHRESAVGESPAEINMYQEADAQHMLALGISSSFVDKVFSTPSSNLWIPTVDELKAAHVITDVSARFDTPDGEKMPANLAEQLLGENPFKTMQTRDPDRYKALHDRLTPALSGYAREPEAGSLPTHDIAPLSIFYFAHASDALAVEFAQALATYFAKVGGKNPDQCYFVVYPERAPAQFQASDVLFGDELERFTDLQVRLVSDGAQRNAPVPSKREVTAALDAMAQQFREKYPGMVSTFDNMDSPTADHGSVCTAMTEMLVTILALPDAQRGPLLRYLFGPT